MSTLYSVMSPYFLSKTFLSLTDFFMVPQSIKKTERIRCCRGGKQLTFFIFLFSSHRVLFFRAKVRVTMAENCSGRKRQARLLFNKFHLDRYAGCNQLRDLTFSPRKAGGDWNRKFSERKWVMERRREEVCNRLFVFPLSSWALRLLTILFSLLALFNVAIRMTSLTRLCFT